MHLLLQLHAPLDNVDRTLYVFGCNNASCHSSMGMNGVGGGGDEAMSKNTFRSWICNGRCFRSQQRWTNKSLAPSLLPTSVDETKNNLEAEDNRGAENLGSDGGWGDNDGDNDWGGGDNVHDIDRIGDHDE